MIVLPLFVHRAHRTELTKPWQSRSWAQVLHGFHKYLWLLAGFVGTL